MLANLVKRDNSVLVRRWKGALVVKFCQSEKEYEVGTCLGL